MVMGFIIRTLILRGTNHKSHGQNSGALTQLGKLSQNFVPPFLQLAVYTIDRVYTHNVT